MSAWSAFLPVTLTENRASKGNQHCYAWSRNAIGAARFNHLCSGNWDRVPFSPLKPKLTSIYCACLFQKWKQCHLKSLCRGQVKPHATWCLTGSILHCSTCTTPHICYIFTKSQPLWLTRVITSHAFRSKSYCSMQAGHSTHNCIFLCVCFNELADRNLIIRVVIFKTVVNGLSYTPLNLVTNSEKVRPYVHVRLVWQCFVSYTHLQHHPGTIINWCYQQRTA